MRVQSAPGSPALLPAAVTEVEKAPGQHHHPSEAGVRAQARRVWGQSVLEATTLTVPVPLGPRLHPLQVRRHQQRALESQRLAFPPEGDAEFLQKLDVEVHVRDHGGQGHCTGQRARSHSRPAGQSGPLTTACARILTGCAVARAPVSPPFSGRSPAPRCEDTGGRHRVIRLDEVVEVGPGMGSVPL